MKRLKIFFVVLAGVVLFLTLPSACAAFGAGPQRMGSISISFVMASARTLEPDVTIQAQRFRITCTPVESGSPVITGLSGSATESGKIFLGEGTWDVLVEALGDGDAVVGEGSARADIVRGDLTRINVAVNPVDGLGTLYLEGAIEAGSVGAGTWIAELAPVDMVGPLLSIPLIGAGSSLSLADAGIPAGYYSLTVILRSGQTVMLASLPQALRIAAGLDTRATFKVSFDILSARAHVEFTEMPAVVHVNVLGLSSIQRGLPGILTVISDPPATEWQWYLDKVPLPDKTASTLDLETSLAIGLYRIDVVVTTSYGLGTGTFALNVTDDTIVFYESGTYDAKGHVSTWNKYSDPGPDDIWMTVDDDQGSQSANYAYIYDAEGRLIETRLFVSAGADGDWSTFADNSLFAWWPHAYDELGRLSTVTYWSGGSTYLSPEGDVLISGGTAWYRYVYYYNANESQVEWMDYVPSGVQYTYESVYDSSGRKIREVQYTGSGSDGIWHTASDNTVNSYTASIYDSASMLVRDVSYSGAGNDNQWFTADDLITSYAVYEYDSSGRKVANIYYNGPGADGIWQ
jgi:hypothetical protein